MLKGASMKLLLITSLISASAIAQNFGPPPGVPGKLEDQYLKKEDQKYFKNEPFTGQSESERTDSLVKEINVLHGKIAKLEQQLQSMQKEIDEMKKK